MTTLKLGLVVSLAGGIEAALDKVTAFDLPTCQITVADPDFLTEELATQLRHAAATRGIEITTVWTHCRRGQVWNFTDGPATIGLVPPETRRQGVATLKKGADFALWLGVRSITTHVGFIPENPGDPLYAGVIEALGEIAAYCRQHDQLFCFETGQETPVTLLRAIEDTGADNVGINLDPANLLMYGKANPIDALDIIGRYVRGVHAKDGEYPTNGRQLGRERPLGEGRVNFPVLISKLKALGYVGALTIEHEVHGPLHSQGIVRACRMLTPLL